MYITFIVGILPSVEGMALKHIQHVKQQYKR